MNIITVSLSPVYDVFYNIPSFTPFSENTASSVTKFTGGKGINVSRALLSAGVKNYAVLLLGKENGNDFLKSVQNDGVDSVPVFTDGRLRENITVLSEKGETRINYNAFYASKHDLDNVLSCIHELIKHEGDTQNYIICSGRFPSGISDKEAEDFVLSLKSISPFVALDSASISYEQISVIKPWLIKPNELEAEAITESKLSNTNDALYAAETIHRLGIDNVLISLGRHGAVYCGELGSAVISVPNITPVSTVGAGDSTLAGFVSAYSESKDCIFCLKRACAFGTAACLTEGTMPPRKEDIDFIAKNVTVEII